MSNRFAALAALVVLSACSDPAPEPVPTPGQDPNRPKQVLVGNYPLAYLTQRVAGNTVQVDFPAPPGVDPAFWQPSDDALRRYQNADLILLNGAGYEHWAAMTSLPTGKVIDTSKGFAAGLIDSGETVTHSHGPSGEHAHSGTAFTTWLDPSLALQQATAIRDAILQLVRVQDQPDVLKRFARLERDLKDYDEVLGGVIGQDRQRPIIASHPVYQYLQRRYRMNLKSVHWEPGETPTDAQWLEFDAMRAEHPAIFMIWESQPIDATVRALAERGVTCVVVDPCANAPSEGDWMAVMRHNAEALSVAYRL